MDVGTIIALLVMAVIVFLIVSLAGRRNRQRPGGHFRGSDGYMDVMNKGHDGQQQHQHHHHHQHAGGNWGGHHGGGHDFGGGGHHSGGDFGGGFGGGHHG